MKNKFSKYLITFFLLLLVFAPVTYFLILPNYNVLIGSFKRFDVKRGSYDIFFSTLIHMSPTTDQVLGSEEILVEQESIEEYLGQVDIVDSILEDLDTRLYVDSIDVEGDVFQGKDSNTMDKGFWHFPTSVYPGQQGNSVIIAHRFLNLPPAKDTFYNLDKVKKGDSIVVKQKDNEFTYIVSEIKVVEKNDISVLQDTTDHQITLITCTPLWTSKQRLVVIGKLDKLYQKT